MNSMTIGGGTFVLFIIDFLFLFEHVEICKPNCHKRKKRRMVQVRKIKKEKLFDTSIWK
jgi:hypothetical protein